MISPEDLLARLDPEQRSVALALEGPVRVLAGAGTGKTRAIIHRVAYGVALGAFDPQQVLAVTFTTRAAGEMRTRLADLGVQGAQARTFHSAALRQVRYFWPKVWPGEMPPLLDSKFGLVAGAARRCGLQPDTAVLRDLAAEIEWSKVSNVAPDRYGSVAAGARRSVNGVEAEVVASVYEAYEAAKAHAQRLDLEDVLLRCAVLMEDARVAASVRGQYRHFIVDEFQDVSPIQYALMRLWLGERDDVCVVGDPAQTIYSFAGARADYLLNFGSDFASTTALQLVRNYRSVGPIVAAANEVVRGATRAGLQLAVQRTEQPADALTLTGYADELAEAEAVAREIQEFVSQGGKPSDVAILVRVNAYTEAFEEVLAQVGVPYAVRGSERFFNRAEVKKAVTLLRGSARAQEQDAEGLVGLIKAVLGPVGWSAQTPTSRGTARDSWESMQSLVQLGESFAESAPSSSLADFVVELERRARDQEAPAQQGVTIASLHSAKGLEWPVVFLVGMHEGNMPIAYAETEAEITEEQRLLYVGITRGRDRLAISWAKARTPGGRGQRKPSRFLRSLLPAEFAVVRESGTSPQKRGSKKVPTCSVCNGPVSSATERKLRRHEDCAPEYDEALFESLKEWRRGQAAEASVPAYVVFTDSTLQAIAERRPANETDLLKIPGIGAKKLESYGADVLALLAGSSSPE